MKDIFFQKSNFRCRENIYICRPLRRLRRLAIEYVNKVGHYKSECQLDVKETTSSRTSVKESKPRQPEEDSQRSENSKRSDQQV